MARCTSSKNGIHLELEANEADLLRFTGRELRRLLKNGNQGGQKLTAFSPTRQRENDEMAVVGDLEVPMEAELLLHRLERIERIQKELVGQSDDQPLDLYLDETQSDIWLAYLADLRLLLAEVIGITQGNPDPFTEEDPEEWTMEMQMYHFLSVLQEWILDAVS